MKVMVIVKATPGSEAGEATPEIWEEMGKFNEALIEAGILLAAEGLHPSSNGLRVHFSGSERFVIAGPFEETKELMAGFWIWQVQSLEEALGWVKRCPRPMREDSDIEIRPIWSPEEVGDVFSQDFQQQLERKDAKLEARKDD